MRHRITGRQLGRNTNQRKALFRGLVTSLIKHGRIETTLAKAREIRGIAEKIITLGKRGDLHARKLALSYIYTEDTVSNLFDKIAPRMKDRNGGYLRIVKTRRRYGDGAEMGVIELIDYVTEKQKLEKKKEEKKKVEEKKTVEKKEPKKEVKKEEKKEVKKKKEEKKKEEKREKKKDEKKSKK
jgi:large subunit ribosomal protein L17